LAARVEPLGVADDAAPADGPTIFTFEEAKALAEKSRIVGARLVDDVVDQQHILGRLPLVVLAVRDDLARPALHRWIRICREAPLHPGRNAAASSSAKDAGGD
jgi:hypothetical protein